MSFPVLVPPCPKCHNSEHVKFVRVAGVAEGVHYWACDKCRRTWGTQQSGATDLTVAHRAEHLTTR